MWRITNPDLPNSVPGGNAGASLFSGIPGGSIAKINLAAQLSSTGQPFVSSSTNEIVVFQGYLHEFDIGEIPDTFIDLCILTRIDSAIDAEDGRYWYDEVNAKLYRISDSIAPPSMEFAVENQVTVEQNELGIGVGHGDFAYASIEYVEVRGRKYLPADLTTTGQYTAIAGLTAPSVGSTATIRARINAVWSPLLSARMFQSDVPICVVDAVVYHGKQYLPLNDIFRPAFCQAVLNFRSQRITLYDEITG